MGGASGASGLRAPPPHATEDTNAAHTTPGIARRTATLLASHALIELAEPSRSELSNACSPVILDVLNTTFNIRRLVVPVLLALGLVAVVVFALRGGRPVAPSGVLGPQASQGAGTDAQHLVSILQYLESDYPAAVASNDAGELAEQRSLSADALSAVNALPLLSSFAGRVASVDARVQKGADARGVGADCASLVEDLIAATGIARTPGAPPDLAAGAKLYADNCAGCHGATGHGDGAAALALHPRPADFHSDAVMGALTPFKAFNVVRFGVKGTAMVPVDGLDEKQRWALAFYLFSLRQPECDHAPPSVSLDVLANSTDGDLARSEGAEHLACLRRRLPDLDAPALLAAARAEVESGGRFAAQGDATRAEKAILDAYLADIEPIEPWLRTHGGDVVSSLEASFTATRAALQQRDPSAQNDVRELISLLDRAAGAHAKATKLSVFWFSLLVITREGFEATVIIAALLAVLKKRKETSRARFVHGGWISALVVGAVVFAVGRNVLAGAMNERLEGCLALVAVVMLLHAALWVNARGTTRKTMGELRDRTKDALDRGALALFGIAFLAMFRESFETAVFLEALSIDAPSAVAWGAAAGVLLLVGLVLAIGRAGLRLPMKTLFDVSTVILVATAVVLLGQGIHSFEEVGIIPSRPIPFLRVEFLGIYPDRLGLLAQLVLAAAPLAWKGLARRAARRAPLDGAADAGE
jgi:high-affinity iron transporter